MSFSAPVSCEFTSNSALPLDQSHITKPGFLYKEWLDAGVEQLYDIDSLAVAIV